MLICPDCHHDLPSPGADRCLNCGWSLEVREGIPILLSCEDRSNPVFRGYSDNYEQIAADDLAHSILDPAYIEAQAEKMLSYIPPAKGIDVCELGVGQGYLIRRLRREAPRQLIGIDISYPYLRKLRSENFSVVVANAENIPYRDAFDLIVATDILEHVLNVGDVLVGVNRALRMGGVFAVRVPTLENLLQYARQKGCPYHFVHLRTFSKDILKSLLGSAGFRVKKFHLDGFQQYRRRAYTLRQPCRIIVEKLLQRRYPQPGDLARIDNRIGIAMLHPIELVAIARKERVA